MQRSRKISSLKQTKTAVIGLRYYRHVLMLLRKQDICHCGCKGWCSLYPAFCFLRWSLEILRNGEMPSSRHDGAPWGKGDGTRATWAGDRLTFRVACVLIKGDLHELCVSWGFPSTASLDPCIFCNVTNRDFLAVVGMSPHNTSFRKKTFEDYNQACAKCEIWVTMSWGNFQIVRSHLIYYTQDRVLGRGLSSDVPALGLLKNDRLEPSATFPDVATIDKYNRGESDEICLLFWRRSFETHARHRNPFFSAELGVTPDSFAVDWMHTLSLGPMNRFIARFCHMLFVKVFLEWESGADVY